MKGTCKSLTELEYFCEEVYKATTEKLDWINPEGRQYPHDLRKPLPLVPNSQGRHVIPFHHFINNDLEYLHGGESSRKYSTSVTKTTVADYEHVKWIEDLVPNSMWSQMIVNYDKFALWGISYWGKKRRQFYAFATTRESARPTFELMKGTCKSLTEPEYFCEEVYKATTKKLDWINSEGRQYPHDLQKPLPFVPNSQGRHVIPFHHFINNNLEYLRGGESSRKNSTSVTKTKAADYGQIKWIEDLVPNSMWSQVIVNYDKFALWGISHWGKKRRQFYAFAATRESARDVYSKRRIIAVTKVEIVEWQNYKHLDWITVRRDDGILNKFKEGDFHRLRIQDIEDMLLLLVQGKLTNLNVEERLAFNVSLRMFTRSVVIQRHVEDLQLGVESYQKKLNLTKLDTYISNLRRRDAYTPYSNPRGFIYENKDKKNRLMRIDELHKFSDGTLDDVRTALNDRLKGIRMEYLP
ncbi:hypothetical protein Tco_0932080 [Tanacetum coccineum]